MKVMKIILIKERKILIILVMKQLIKLYMKIMNIVQRLEIRNIKKLIIVKMKVIKKI